MRAPHWSKFRWSKFSAIAVLALVAPLAAVPSASAATPAPATSPAPSWGGWWHPAPYKYLLSLGDSLGFGYSDANVAAYSSSSSPDISIFKGYADELASDSILAGSTGTTNFACPGETTTSMIDGGCPWLVGPLPAVVPAGATLPLPLHNEHNVATPQLAAATGFLADHQAERGVITLSIGSNDALNMLTKAPSCATDPTCAALKSMLKTVHNNLTTILSDLRHAAPKATIVVLTPYNPLAHMVPASNIAAVALDATIGLTALLNGARVADAFGPINVQHATNFDCENLIYFCSSNPNSPFATDIHPTEAGYGVIEKAFEKVLG
ncbi:MAG: SGNH/GDSL hydrolase family protein [Nakamurella sp.]